MTRLIYETHSITVDNENGVATGWLPGELSEEGIREAEAIGPRRRDVDVVFSSDLRRAVHTVELAGLAAPHFQDWRLRECNYGELNGAPVSILDLERLTHIDAPWLGGESYADVVDRTRTLLADLRASRGGARVLLVAHSANRWALQHLLQGVRLVDVIGAPFAWQPGWEFELP